MEPLQLNVGNINFDINDEEFGGYIKCEGSINLQIAKFKGKPYFAINTNVTVTVGDLDDNVSASINVSVPMWILARSSSVRIFARRMASEVLVGIAKKMNHEFGSFEEGLDLGIIDSAFEGINIATGIHSVGLDMWEDFYRTYIDTVYPYVRSQFPE